MLKKIALFVVSGVIATASIHTTSVIAQSTGSNSSHINTYVEKALDQYNIPGASLKIINGEQNVVQQSWGTTSDGKQITSDTPFLIGSLSKTITALSILQLEQNNMIDLGTEINTYLPTFQYTSPNDTKVTVQQLLDQTSGISALDGLEVTDRNYSEMNGISEAVEALSGVQLQNVPGKQYQYTSANYLLLGAIVEQVSGMPYAKYVEENIFTPLSMTRTSATHADSRNDGLSAGNQSWVGNPVKASGFYDNSGAPYGYISSTANDLFTFLAFLYGGDQKVLSTEQLKRFTQKPSADATYKFGWHYSHKDALFYHGGATPEFRTEMFYDPDKEFYGVILTNKYHSLEDQQVSYIMAGVRDIATGKQPQALPQQSHLEQWVLIGAGLLSLVTLLIHVWRLAERRTSRRPWRYAIAGILALLSVAIWLGAPYLFGAPWHSILLFAPDIAYLLILLIVIISLNATLFLGRRSS